LGRTGTAKPNCSEVATRGTSPGRHADDTTDHKAGTGQLIDPGAEIH
jgi:hypothetical protein